MAVRLHDFRAVPSGHHSPLSSFAKVPSGRELFHSSASIADSVVSDGPPRAATVAWDNPWRRRQVITATASAR